MNAPVQESTAAKLTVTTDLRLEIQALTNEYAYRIDHGASNAIFELYSVDGELLGLPPKDLIGRDAIQAWGSERVKMPRLARHVETNHRLEWRDGVLHGTLYASVYRSDTPEATNTAPFMVGDYEDQYVQEDGLWRIRRRVIRRGFRIAT